MDSATLTDVCRLCPSSEDLLLVFDTRQIRTYNIREVILVTTGIEILESDIVSKKVCQKCCNITLKMFEFRQDALKQDRHLKDKCKKLLVKGIKLPNTCITIRKDSPDDIPEKRPKMEVPDESHKKPELHNSIADIYKTYPHLKLPKKCFTSNMAPVVSLAMGHVENYFKIAKLDMRQFIYRPKSRIKPVGGYNVAKKKTSATQKTVASTSVDTTSTIVDTTPTSVDTTSTSVDTTSTSVATTSTSVATTSTSLKKTPRTRVIVEKPSVLDETSVGDNVCNENPVVSTPEVRTSVIGPPPACELAPSINKPEFIESLGLTPTVTTTKSQPLHVCPICGSNHNTTFEVKRHLQKHMVCQFCKVRFKSVEAKMDHIDNDCEVKKIMNSRAVVRLEKIDKNISVRCKYETAFDGYPLLVEKIESSFPTPVVMMKRVTIPTDEVIVLSDDEPSDSASSTTDIPSTSANAVPEASSNTSIVKPDVRIRNNSVLNFVKTGISEVDVIKSVLGLISRSAMTDKSVQTDLPLDMNLKVSSADSTCEFKYLKEHLKTYKVPIEISHGHFAVTYGLRIENKSKKPKALWSDVPFVDMENNIVTRQGVPNGRIVVQSSNLVKPSVSVPKVPKSPVILQNIPLPVLNQNATSSPVRPIMYSKPSPVPVVLAIPPQHTPNVANVNRSPSTLGGRGKITPNFIKSRVTNTPIPIRPRVPAQPAPSTSDSTANRFRVKNVWELQ